MLNELSYAEGQAEAMEKLAIPAALLQHIQNKYHYLHPKQIEAKIQKQMGLEEEMFNKSQRPRIEAHQNAAHPEMLQAAPIVGQGAGSLPPPVDPRFQSQTHVPVPLGAAPTGLTNTFLRPAAGPTATTSPGTPNPTLRRPSVPW